MVRNLAGQLKSNFTCKFSQPAAIREWVKLRTILYRAELLAYFICQVKPSIAAGFLLLTHVHTFCFRPPFGKPFWLKLFFPGFLWVTMAPKKVLACSQIVRSSQVALADTCQKWEVNCSAHALDLEIRAALARRMAGGDGICTGPCAASNVSPVEQVVPAERAPENPFEEYASEKPSEQLGYDMSV